MRCTACGHASTLLKLKPNWREGRTPAEVRLIEQKLIELEKLYEDNPLAAVSFDKIPKQERYIGSKHFYKLLAAGNGFGKTFTGTVDDLIQLCDREVLPARLLKYKRWDPPFHMRIVVPKFGLAESVALEKFRELTPPAQLIGGNFDKAYDKVNRKLRFANGSWVVFNTSDQDVNAHAGVELHRVRFDEEPEGELGFRIYNENLMRLRKAMPDAQVCFTFTPQNGLGWTYELFWEERGEEVEPGVFEDDKMLIVVASMLDNPYIDGAALLEMANLPPEEYAARVEGKFVSFHGRVLEVRDRHRVDPPDPKHVRQLDTLVGIDPGIARAAAVWVGFDRDNVALVYDELYPSGMTAPEFAQAIKDKNEEWGVKPQQYIIDPSARNRNLATGENIESLFLKEGIPTLPGQNDRRTGILQMRARLAADPTGLLISKACVNLLKETERWVVAEDEKLAEDKATAGGDTFKTKGPDHAADSLRYTLFERLWYQPAAKSKKLWHPSMGGAPPASWFTHSVENSGPPLGSMT